MHRPLTVRRFVSAEVAPFSKTGGLGDVMGALPKALAARGHRVMVVTPRYLSPTTEARYAGSKDLGVHKRLDLGLGGAHDVTFWHMVRVCVWSARAVPTMCTGTYACTPVSSSSSSHSSGVLAPHPPRSTRRALTMYLWTTSPTIAAATHMAMRTALTPTTCSVLRC
jgi:hypothetical protein